MTPGPGRVMDAGLQQSIATREPNLEPRRETMCLLNAILVLYDNQNTSLLTECGWRPAHVGGGECS